MKAGLPGRNLDVVSRGLCRRTLLGSALALRTCPVARAAAGRSFRVAVIMNGSIADGGWNELGYAGLRQVARLPDVTTAYAENVAQVDVMEMSRGYADDGYDLIIGHGFAFGSTFMEVAPEYPGQKFFATASAPEGRLAANLAFINLNYYQMSFATGCLAALLSRPGHGVGFVGGQDNPSQRRMMHQFQAGASSVRPDINPMGIVPGDFNNATMGREAAQTLIGHGADVLWHAADVTGLGVLRAAEANDVTVIGCYTDQSDIAPRSIVSSTVINIPWMISYIVSTLRAGNFPGGQEWVPPLDQIWSMRWHDMMFNPARVSADATRLFPAMWRDISDGHIAVREEG